MFCRLGAQAAADSFDGSRPGMERKIEGIRFCWAPSGSFRMGSPPEEPERRTDEGPENVTITRGFWIGKYEVMQREWSIEMGAFRRDQDKGRGPDVPVYWVSLAEADEFCRRLTARARRPIASGRLGDPASD
ncbi:MAG: SUMF1/EgtB/PvdO family nonheme iron enzyme [Bryobacteraceae bacterium]|nr:SUMF1/EgtB/PvdO family nonheme iron enzyme [Bryobacteraceae bacterium]